MVLMIESKRNVVIPTHVHKLAKAPARAATTYNVPHLHARICAWISRRIYYVAQSSFRHHNGALNSSSLRCRREREMLRASKRASSA
jgi:hypothetical protein